MGALRFSIGAHQELFDPVHAATHHGKVLGNFELQLHGMRNDAYRSGRSSALFDQFLCRRSVGVEGVDPREIETRESWPGIESLTCHERDGVIAKIERVARAFILDLLKLDKPPGSEVEHLGLVSLGGGFQLPREIKPMPCVTPRFAPGPESEHTAATRPEQSRQRARASRRSGSVEQRVARRAQNRPYVIDELDARHVPRVRAEHFRDIVQLLHLPDLLDHR